MKYLGPHGTIPLWVKLAFSIFMAVLVPIYWQAYSHWNFLFFCDVASAENLTVVLEQAQNAIGGIRNA